ncbi:Uu.00g128610.m01.CDS01 [Anthostomella pinea]|uniref:Uu.00g128610.m01.CDS01 n=1 Tax=Anthostomella pinea TaxID=933095 RepID=A0AAI8VD14_9PEZI|nr:Uu.00g128610.m01.CDS01 [Anthostomella pinea]
MAPHNISVIYPAGTKFDMDYYLKSHMPLVQKKWAPYGLTSWKVAHYTNEGAPYVVQAWLEFGSADQWAKASASPEAKEVMGDIPNFSDKQPAMLIGDVVGGETC